MICETDIATLGTPQAVKVWGVFRRKKLQEQKMAFTHLHTHTEYSLLDGANKISEYVKRVKELGMDSAAITDHGVMYGVIDFYRAARAEGIKPVLGCEVYVAPGSRFDKSGANSEDKYYHLVLLAENNKGYENLMKIVSRGFTEGYYYKPRVDFELLQEYHEGIIALSACLAGEIPRNILRGLVNEAEKIAKRYQDCFGRDNFYLELQSHGIADQERVNMALMQMSKKLDIPLVATNDIHYTYAEDVRPHDILLCLQTGKRLADEDRMRYEGGQYFVKSEEEMRALFPYAPEAIENTHRIAERCNVEIEFGNTKLPHFEVPEGYDSWTYLNKLCMDGLEERYPQDDGSLKKRLDYELSTIKKMGYVDYFLIVWDFINYARANKIPVGPGRGSAAGSIVSYCLHITNIDPIRYNLLFERFLNPERVSMPDIDIDFCYERRQEVIDYVVKKYGREKVVQIVTFGTLGARNVIRDVARVMDFPYARTDSLAKMIPNELNITLEKALAENSDLRQLYEADGEIHDLIDMCKRLEGLPRHTSMHAAGVVICQKNAEEFVPLSRAQDGTITTQFTMTTIEELGLLKMDFLGLRTLTVIKDALSLIEQGHGEKIDIDHIDYEDKNIYDLIGSGKCEGIFQLESRGMKSFMKDLKPQSLEDVIAGISLYRPGPMEFIGDYIKGKNNQDEIKYACEQLRPILEPTYGCIVYQEQVMQIVRDLGGYSLGRSDLVRRAMSKKKQKVMEQERANFIYGNEAEGVPGCISKGISEKVADGIYNSMMDFAKYAFNKSHAACYAVVAYQTAYLKYYYPTEFMAALMTSVLHDAAKVSEYIQVCRGMGIGILAPDINEGFSGFSVSGNNIRYGLSAIKNVGKPVIDAIVSERNYGGPYRDLKDLTQRVGSDLNKRAMENFIKAGALDCFGVNRRQLIAVYASIMDQVADERKNNVAGQMTLFDFLNGGESQNPMGAAEIVYPPFEEFDKQLILEYEKEVMGIYVSGHPLEQYEKLWKRIVTARAIDFRLDPDTGQSLVRDNQRVTIGGIISSLKVRRTKTDKLMANLTIEDLLGSVEVLVWPRDYEKARNYLSEDAKVFITGKVSAKDDKDAELICESVMPFEMVPGQLWLQLEDKAAYEEAESSIFEILDGNPGKDALIIYLKSDKAKKSIRGKGINSSPEVLEKLERLFGKDNVKLI